MITRVLLLVVGLGAIILFSGSSNSKPTLLPPVPVINVKEVSLTWSVASVKPFARLYRPPSSSVIISLAVFLAVVVVVVIAAIVY